LLDGVKINLEDQNTDGLTPIAYRRTKVIPALLTPSYSPNPARVASVGGFEAVGVLYPGL